MICGACRKTARNTSLAFVACPATGLRRARVCAGCFKKAVHIVPSVTTTVKPTNEVTAQRREATDAVKGAIRKLKTLVRVYGADDEATNGLEQAIDILEAGDF